LDFVNKRSRTQNHHHFHHQLSSSLRNLTTCSTLAWK
jgi:hypothetical protein